MDKLIRREIRYICFRIQTETEGGNKATSEEEGPMKYADEIKSHMESQDDFGGWRNFAKTWDVDQKAPLVIVARTKSIQSEWNAVLAKEAKDLPSEKEKKKLLTNKLSKKIQAKKDVLKNFSAEEISAAQGVTPLPDKPEPNEGKKLLENEIKAKVEERKAQSGKKSFWDKLR
jgi:hypothetical protein